MRCETRALRACAVAISSVTPPQRATLCLMDTRPAPMHNTAPQVAVLVYKVPSYPVPRERYRKARQVRDTRQHQRARSSAAGSSWPSHGRRRWARLVARGSLRRHEQIAATDARQAADSSRRAERTTSAHRNGCALRVARRTSTRAASEG